MTSTDYCKEGWDYALKDKYSDAILSFQNAINLNDKSVEAYYGIAECFRVQKIFLKAIEYYEFVTNLDSKINSYYLRGFCLKGLYRYQEAIKKFEQAIEDASHTEEAYWAIGECFRMQKDYKTAIEYYEEAVKVNSTWGQPYQGLAQCLLKQKKYTEAFDKIEQAIKLDSNSSEFYNIKAECLRKFMNYEEAIIQHEMALKLNSQEEETYEGIGECLRKINRYDEAIDKFEHAIKLNPEWAEPFYGIGECLRAQRYYKEAIDKYEEAITRNNNWAEPYWGIGECTKNKAEEYISRNKDDLDTIKSYYDKAKTFYYKAISRDSEHGQSYWGLSEIPANFFKSNEIHGIPNFNKALRIFSSIDIILNFSRLLKCCLKYNEVFLVFDILKIDFNKIFQLRLHSLNLDEIISISAPFVRQFDLWKKNESRSQQSYSLEAIMRFHLGSAISCYDIYDNDMEDTVESPISIKDQYYFALAAYNIIEDHKGCLKNYALPLARKVVVNKDAIDEDKYYAALVMDLTGLTNDAIKILFQLKESGFIPAYLKWAELKRKDFENDDTYQEEIIADMASDYTLTGSPYLYPEIVLATGNEEKMTKDLMPLIQIMENRQMLELIHAWQSKNQLETKDSVFEERYLFARRIIFPHLQEDKLQDYIYNYYPEVHSQVFGSDEDVDDLQADIDYYRTLKIKGKGYLDKLADEIHKDLHTNYTYARDKLKCPPEEVDYRYDLILITHLQKENIIKKDEASLLHEYIKYGMGVVQNIYNEALQFLIDKAKDYIPTAALCGIGYGDLEKAVNYTFNKVKGKQSDLITFEEYREIVTKRSQDS